MKHKISKIIVIICLVCCLFMLSSCLSPSTIREGREYYSKDENYEIIKGNICEITEYNESVGLSIVLDEYEGKTNVRIDKFLIKQKNVEELHKNSFEFGISDKKYIFITAFGILADGWCYPIVGVQEIDNSVVYLDFQTGKANYLEWYDENVHVFPF